MRAFTDVAGRHAVRLNNSAETRKDLAQRLRIAGCEVNLDGSDWLTAGDLTPPLPPGKGLPLGKRVPASDGPIGTRLDARFHDRSGGSGRLELINHGPADVLDLNIELPENVGGFFVTDHGLPIQRLPAGKSHSFVCGRTMGSPAYLDVVLTGRTEDEQPIRQSVFVSLGA
jgi:hypothetical protein